MSRTNNISNNIGNINSFSFIDEKLRETKDVKESSSFGDFFSKAMEIDDETSRLEREAEQMQIDYVLGRTDDILGVQLAEQKAYTALSFTVQITNKIVDAYKQIMSMQM